MIKIKIYYHHTDSGGVVYYARYLDFLEEARTEFLANKGFLIKELISKGVFFVVARQEVDYKAPAFYGDTLTVKAKVSEVSTVKLVFEQEIFNQEDKLLTKARTILVCVDKALKPQALPDELKKAVL
jgi:acyl-CoA thioester hydrolase